MESETKSEGIDATNGVLCRRGYAGLAMKNAPEESPMTTAGIHYPVDTKAESVNAFLGWRPGTAVIA